MTFEQLNNNFLEMDKNFKNYEGVFNRSLNRFGINNPKETKFYSSRVATDFLNLKKKEDPNFLNNNENDIIREFFDFHDAFLLKKFKKNTFAFFKERYITWVKRSKDTEDSIKDIAEEYVISYLYKSFIPNTIRGIIREKRVRDTLKMAAKKNGLEINVKKGTAKNDAEDCIDLIVEGPKINFYCQVKPITFFGGLGKGTTVDSMIKIDKAITAKKLPLFIVLYDDMTGETSFVIRHKEIADDFSWVGADDFLKVLLADIKEEDMYIVAKNTSTRLLNMNKNMNLKGFAKKKS